MTKSEKTVEQRIREYYTAQTGEGIWLVEKGKVKEAKLLKEACLKLERQSELLKMTKVHDEVEDKLKTAEARLQDQTHLIEQLFALLDITEETEDGRVFHPTTIRSSRALDAEKLEKILTGLRGLQYVQRLYAWSLHR